MKCPKCGFENDDNAYFCEGCGNKLKDNTGVENNQADNAKFELDKDLGFDSDMNYGTINKSNLEDNSSFDYYDDFNKNVSYEYLMKLECYKLIKHLLGEKEYEPFKIWW